MTIKCDYGKPLYKLGDIVLYKGQPYVVIGWEINFDYYDYQYELSPYDENKLEFARKEELVEAD
jgi:hypothetical protein